MGSRSISMENTSRRALSRIPSVPDILGPTWAGQTPNVAWKKEPKLRYGSRPLLLAAQGGCSGATRKLSPGDCFGRTALALATYQPRVRFIMSDLREVK